jgi:hypothetical protein
MRKIFILFFSIQVSTLCFSQSDGFRMGAHFGMGQATIKEANISRQTGKLALQAGLSMNYQFFKNFGLNSNILFTSKGSRSSGSETVYGFFGSKEYTYEEDYSLYYVEIPLMPKLSLGGEKFFVKVFAGPSLNFNLYGKQDKVFDDANYHEQNGFTNREIKGLNLLEYSLVYGGGFDVEVSDNSIFSLEVRESRSLNSFGEINTKDAINQYFMVGIGYLNKF